MISLINAFFLKNLTAIEMIGVMMRIFSFSLVSWMGAESPFLFVWAFNTTDAVLLSWCSLLKKDKAYSLLNGFWIIVGVVGMMRASEISMLDFQASAMQVLEQIKALKQ